MPSSVPQHIVSGPQAFRHLRRHRSPSTSLPSTTKESKIHVNFVVVVDKGKRCIELNGSWLDCFFYSCRCRTPCRPPGARPQGRRGGRQRREYHMVVNAKKAIHRFISSHCSGRWDKDYWALCTIWFDWFWVLWALFWEVSVCSCRWRDFTPGSYLSSLIISCLILPLLPPFDWDSIIKVAHGAQQGQSSCKVVGWLVGRWVGG